MRDFTLSSFRFLVESLLCRGFVFLDLESFIGSDDRKKVFLRHDVDRYTMQVVMFAELEQELGICSTYYFRMPQSCQHREIIKTVSVHACRVGYHYEDLSASRGDLPHAIRSFEENLSYLRTLAPVNSICMHGNALSTVNNLDLWKAHDFRKYRLQGDPYLSIDHNKVLYLTDTGRRWNGKGISRWDKVKNAHDYHPKSTSGIIEDINNDYLPSAIHICVHPEHYHDNVMSWTKYKSYQFVKNLAKAALLQLNGK